MASPFPLMPSADRDASMSNALATGARAERLAEAFLTARGLVLIARNFRIRHGEIDLILRDGATLVFAEVRLRTNKNFGGAAASITPAKQARLRRAARAFLARLPNEPPCRFDAVLLDGLDAARITWEQGILDD